MRSKFMIYAGRFFFKFRSLLFPAIFVFLLAACRPRVYTDPRLYDLILIAGFIIVLGGQIIRILTIGLDYIERGGKKHTPFASRLVTNGIYAHVRNPMYVGNLLIAIGIGFYSGSLLVLVTVVPFFVFVYFTIVAAEEDFLRNNFSWEYKEYCERVNRFVPSLRNLGTTISAFTFNWRRVVDKENGTAFYTFLALTLLPLWRMHFLGVDARSHHYQLVAWALLVVLIPGYIFLQFLKKTGRLMVA